MIRTVRTVLSEVPAGTPLLEVLQRLLGWLSARYPDYCFHVVPEGEPGQARPLHQQTVHDGSGQPVARVEATGPRADPTLDERLRLLADAAELHLVRTETLRRLEEQAAHSQVILDLAIDAILTIDERGIIQSANRATEKMFGFRCADLIGRNVSVLMPEPFRSEHDGYIRRYLETGEARIIGIGRQVTARRRDGSIFPAHLAVSQFQREGAGYFVGFVRDISDLVELRSELNRREVQYKLDAETVRAMTAMEERRFLSRELHDSVSQALFGIVLGTNAAIGVLDQPDKAREAMDYVHSLAESGLAEMRALILELRPESLESEGLIGSLLRQVRAVARRYRLSLDLHMGDEPGIPIEVKHDCYRLAMEAVHNVVKHAQARTLTVRLQQGSHGVEVEVRDDGIGFDASVADPLRVGLQSMRERAEAAGGTLTIDTAPGQGTRVHALFPVELVL
ncbi:MAG: PAS domain S-box protein [Candidatus Eremiobacterota bacterium]